MNTMLILVLTLSLCPWQTFCAKDYEDHGEVYVDKNPRAYFRGNTTRSYFSQMLAECLEMRYFIHGNSYKQNDGFTPFFPETKEQLDHIKVNLLPRKNTFGWIGAYKIDGRFISISGKNLADLKFLNWMKGHPDLSAGDVVKINEHGELLTDFDGNSDKPTVSLCEMATGLFDECLYISHFGPMKNMHRYCIPNVALGPDKSTSVYSMSAICSQIRISMAHVGRSQRTLVPMKIISPAKTLDFPLDWPWFSIPDRKVQELLFMYTDDNQLYDPIQNKFKSRSSAAGAGNMVLCEEPFGNCIRELYWKDKVLWGIHFFNYSINHVFKNNEKLPDRSGLGRDIRLTFNKKSRPVIREDDRGLRYLHLVDNAKITVTAEVTKNIFTVEYYGIVSEPSNVLIQFHNRDLKIKANGLDFALPDDGRQDLRVHAQSNTLVYLATRYVGDRYPEIDVYKNADVAAYRQLHKPFQETETDKITVRGSVYFARLIDIEVPKENISITYDCLKDLKGEDINIERKEEKKKKPKTFEIYFDKDEKTPYKIFEVGGKNYLAGIDEKLSHSKAAKKCECMGGGLASISTQETMDSISTLMGDMGMDKIMLNGRKKPALYWIDGSHGDLDTKPLRDEDLEGGMSGCHCRSFEVNTEHQYPGTPFQVYPQKCTAKKNYLCDFPHADGKVDACRMQSCLAGVFRRSYEQCQKESVEALNAQQKDSQTDDDDDGDGDGSLPPSTTAIICVAVICITQLIIVAAVYVLKTKNKRQVPSGKEGHD